MTPSPSPVAAVLAELEDLLAKATPGPWERGGYQVVSDGGNGVVAETDTTVDAETIAQLRNAAPRLLAAIRAVDELADEWEDKAAACKRAARKPGAPVGLLYDAEAKGEAYSSNAAALRSALAAVDVAEATE